MFKLLGTTAAAAGLFFGATASQADAGYGAAYGCGACAPRCGYGGCGYAGYGYAPACRTAFVPVPAYRCGYPRPYPCRGAAFYVGTPGFGFGYYR